MLVRPDVPFAVFYNSDPANAQGVRDSAMPGGANFNEDNDPVPDYVERILNCLNEGHKRYKTYYSLDPLTQEDVYIKYMLLKYEVPNPDPMKPPFQRDGKFYPVIVRDVSRRGVVEPLVLPERLGNLRLDIPLGATYMQIDQGDDGYLQRATPPRGSSWLYAGLENIVYHELAHTYQSVYKRIRNRYDWQDNWIYEGTAVYVADQALLPPCNADVPDA